MVLELAEPRLTRGSSEILWQRPQQRWGRAGKGGTMVLKLAAPRLTKGSTETERPPRAGVRVRVRARR